MKMLMIALSLFALSGCAIFESKKVQPEIVVEHRVEKVKVPQDLTAIPEKIKFPEDDATQKDISIWIVNLVKRVNELESKLTLIRISYGE